jgi:hypothetical protein
MLIPSQSTARKHDQNEVFMKLFMFSPKECHGKVALQSHGHTSTEERKEGEKKRVETAN